MKQISWATLIALMLMGATYSYGTTPAWQIKESPENEILRCLSFCPEGNLVGGVFGKGIFVSMNEAESWDKSNAGLTCLNVTSVVRDDNGHIFAATFGGGVFYTSDNCQTWTAINEGLNNKEVVALVVDNKIVFAGTAYGGVYKLESPGGDWEYIGLRGQFINAFAIDPLHRVFAGTDKGVYVHEVGSISWAETNTGFRSADVWALTTDTNGNVYAGTNGAGLYRFSNDDNTWIPLSNSLGDLHIGSIVAGSGEQLTIGTARGVYQSINGGLTWNRLGSADERSKVTSLVMNSSGDYFAATTDGSVLKRNVIALSTR